MTAYSKVMNFSASRLSPLLILPVLALAAVGCTTAPAVSQSNVDGNTNQQISLDQNAEEPGTIEFPTTAAWLDNGSIVTFITWGSSSCLPVIESVKAGGDNSINIALTSPEEPVFCTMDFAPQVNWAFVPEGVNASKVTTLNVLLQDGETEQTVELPALSK